MIEHVEFKNFKALRDVKIDLERFTVLVGPNGSGKTSVLEGLNLLLSAYREKARLAFAAYPKPEDLVTSPHETGMTISCKTSNGSLALCLGKTSISAYGEMSKGGSTDTYSPKGSSGIEDVGIFRAGETTRPPFSCEPVFLRFDPKLLIKPSYCEDPVPQMQPDGGGLPSVLDYLTSNKPDDFKSIIASLRHVIPEVRELRFPRAAVTLPELEVITHDDKTFERRGEKIYYGESIEFDMKNAPRIPAHMISEGTLLVLGLLTALMGPNRPQVILIDDLDRALHPKAQEDLVVLLREFLKKNPDIQIIATSHSPYLLDHLSYEEVRVTTLCDDGSAVCARLNEHPEFDKWKKEMTPGEFWSTIGESWVLEAGMEESAS